MAATTNLPEVDWRRDHNFQRATATTSTAIGQIVDAYVRLNNRRALAGIGIEATIALHSSAAASVRLYGASGRWIAVVEPSIVRSVIDFRPRVPNAINSYSPKGRDRY